MIIEVYMSLTDDDIRDRNDDELRRRFRIMYFNDFNIILKSINLINLIVRFFDNILHVKLRYYLYLNVN